MHLSFIAALVLGLGSPEAKDEPGSFARALWLVQRYGTTEASSPANDQRTKGLLSKALGKDGVISHSEAEGILRADSFRKLAGPDGRLDSDEIRRAVEEVSPGSRRMLFPRVREHADYLTTSFDQIDERHREAGEKLVGWIAERYRPGEPLNLVVVCTGNSRRSMLGATMGNIAAAYYGMPEVRFFSGGTAPTAFNSRTVAALEAIGVEVKKTGGEAPRGEPETVNPVYRVRWGDSFESTEFSKHYADKANPQQGFAALMVCSEADAECPLVKGATIRVSMPYLDPKLFDGGAYESAKYAERRDDMGRLMLSVMMQVRRRLSEKD